jgi:hypothetical protein
MLRLHRIHPQHGCATPWNLQGTETEQADFFGTNHGETEHTERRHGGSVRFIVQSPGDPGFRRAARADPSTAGARSARIRAQGTVPLPEWIAGRDGVPAVRKTMGAEDCAPRGRRSSPNERARRTVPLP